MTGGPGFRFLPALVVVLLVAPFSPALIPAAQPVPPRSPDLIRELYANGPARYRPEATEPQPPDPPLTPALDGMPLWSELAYFTYRNDNWDVYLSDVFAYNQVRLTSETSREMYPSLRIQGDRVIFSSDRINDYEIWSVNPDGSDLQRLTESSGTDTYPAWSPDRSHIAFESYRAGGGDIYVMNADGSNVTRLTTSDAYDGEPAWSPDGSQIVFSSNRNAGYQLWMMNADGSNQHQVTHGNGTAMQPSWSPGGDKIAYAVDGDGDRWLEIWWVNPDGSSEALLWAPNWPDKDLWAPAWSPDGQYIALIETRWVFYANEWWWTTSRLQVRKVADGSGGNLFYDDRIWKADWVSLDTWPPAPCVVTAPADQRSSSFMLSWTTEDVGPAGLDGYEVQVRPSPSSAWRLIQSWSRETGYLYHADSVAQVEFRCRARDIAGHVASWDDAPPAATTVDAAAPRSGVAALPRYVRGHSTPVEWSGDDLGSGLAAYDVWVRQGAGDWQVWQDDVTATTAQFTGSPGQTYSFRSQARDTIGHLETWQPTAQAVTTLYTHVLSGTITDQRGQLGPLPTLDLSPDAPLSPPDPANGEYGFYVAGTSNFSLEAAAPGYGTLPPATVYVDGDKRLDLVFPPEDEAVANGGFETWNLDGWIVTGDGARADAAARHTGQYGLQIAHAVTATTVLSQAISLDAGLHEPTLSLLVRIPAELAAGDFSVRVTGGMTATVWQAAAAPGWTHVWADLSPAAGQTITLTLAMSGAVGTVQVDEVSVGSWQTPVVEAVSPAQWHPGQAPQLSIAGQNFVATPQVLLGGIALDDVTWISATLLTATAPENLGRGTHDLVVANPSGAAVTVPAAVTVAAHTAFLPLVERGWPRSQWRLGSGWPTVGHDVRHTGYTQESAGASRYALAWSAALPYPSSRDMGSIAVADGVVVASSSARFADAAVSGLDAQSGAELWRLFFDHKNSISPAAVAHGSAYILENNGSGDSDVLCVDLYTGEEHWQNGLSAQWDSYMAPIVVDDALYVHSGPMGGLTRYHAGSGSHLWWVTLEEGLSSPAYDGGMVYTWIQGFFNAHDPATGQILWSLEPLGYGDITAPAISEHTAVAANSLGLYGVDLATHEVRWTVEGNFDQANPAIADGTVYALMSGRLQARRLSDGALLWSFVGDQALGNAPAIAGNYVYVASDFHTWVLNRTTQAVEWEVDHGGWLALADGLLYIGQLDETVWAYRAQEP